MTDPNEKIEISTNEARGGSTPGVTRYVLAISLVLIIVVMAAILLY